MLLRWKVQNHHYIDNISQIVLNQHFYVWSDLIHSTSDINFVFSWTHTTQCSVDMCIGKKACRITMWKDASKYLCSSLITVLSTEWWFSWLVASFDVTSASNPNPLTVTNWLVHSVREREGKAKDMQEGERGKERRRQDPGVDRTDRTFTELKVSFS